MVIPSVYEEDESEYDEEEEKKLDETDYVLDYNKPRVIRKRIDAIKEIIMSS